MKNKKNFDNDEFDISDNERNGDEINYDEYYPENEEELVSGELDEDTVVFAIKERERKKGIKKKNGKMTKGQKTLISVISVIYVLLLVLAAWLIFYKPSIDPDEIPFDISETDDEETDESSAKNKDSGKNYSETGQSYNILVVGHDKLAHLADVTMIVNCDTKNKKISVMQIPRDTYVSCEYMTGKINAVYSSYYNKAVRSKADDPYVDSLEEYADLLEKNLCIKIHQSVILNLDGFKNIVDALGGVDVYVPSDMKYSDPVQGLYIDIPAGNQHLNGETAEGFVRFRSGYVQADLGRVNAQKIFLTALFSKVKSTVKSVDVSTLNSLIGEVKNNVYTDMSVSDILYYAKLALKIDLEDISMMTVPGTVAGNYYVINREVTLNDINTYFNVYSKNISDRIFDRDRVFCGTDDYICAAYYSGSENTLDGTYTADSINDDSIYIPRIQQWAPSNDSWSGSGAGNSDQNDDGTDYSTTDTEDEINSRENTEDTDDTDLIVADDDQTENEDEIYTDVTDESDGYDQDSDTNGINTKPEEISNTEEITEQTEESNG